MHIYNNGQSNWSKLALYGLIPREAKIGFNRYEKATHSAGINLIDSSGADVIMLDSKVVREAAKRGRPAISGPRQQLIKPAKIKHVAKERRFEVVGDRRYEKGGFWVIMACGLPTWIAEVKKSG